MLRMKLHVHRAARRHEHQFMIRRQRIDELLKSAADLRERFERRLAVVDENGDAHGIAGQSAFLRSGGSRYRQREHARDGQTGGRSHRQRMDLPHGVRQAAPSRHSGPFEAIDREPASRQHYI
jgi:hypothetical protein